MIRKFGDIDNLEPDEPPVKKGFVRVYEFLHGYEDIPEDVFNAGEKDPLLVMLKEEIQKEIDREIISLINENAKVK